MVDNVTVVVGILPFVVLLTTFSFDRKKSLNIVHKVAYQVEKRGLALLESMNISTLTI